MVDKENKSAMTTTNKINVSALEVAASGRGALED